jgi:hypothetical protein
MIDRASHVIALRRDERPPQQKAFCDDMFLEQNATGALYKTRR